MSLNAEFPGEISKPIDDLWLAGGAAPAGDQSYGVDSAGQEYVDCTHKNDNMGDLRPLRPRGIVVASDDQQNNPSTIYGYLWSENESDVAPHSVPPTGIMHPVAFSKIYRQGTTARGITIYG